MEIPPPQYPSFPFIPLIPKQALRDSDLFRVGNQFTHDMDIKRLGINPLFKRCGINPALWFLVVLMMMSKLVLEPE
jgi:hypothetical protein